LIDPSCPRSSGALYAGRLIGEKYTSGVVSRDLHMYSGVKMKIALHANALFHLLSMEASKGDYYLKTIARKQVITETT
jgi:hypothetical protein